MNILVFGGGAVGLGLSSCLAESGQAVDIVARENTVTALASEGLKRSGILGGSSWSPGTVGAFTGLSDAIAEKKRPYDYILVCTKSNDSLEAAKKISEAKSLYDERTLVVLCQNGWGNREVFLDYFPSKQVANARVITGFCRHEPNHVEVTVHVQPISVGVIGSEDQKNLEPLSEAIEQGGLTCQTTRDIGKDLWAKMLFNCSLNPLGAVFDIPYGNLKQSDQTLSIIEDVVNEIFEVMTAAGYETHWTSAEIYYPFLRDTLIPGAASHESSTLQDIRAGKKTEIDALNGQVVRLGEKLGIPVPVNKMLYRMIRFLEP